MASASSHNQSRRKHEKRHQLSPRRPLTRSNSSFLGAIKNIVTRPLNWFGAADDFEDAKGPQGKRRRAATQPSQPTITTDDDDDDDDNDSRAPRSKRMRVHSPPKDDHSIDLGQPSNQMQLHPPSQDPAHGYLDPPSTVFQQQQYYQSSSRQSLSAAPSMTRSVSVQLPTSTVHDLPYNAPQNTRSTLSPMRNLSISRTMSIDPPVRPTGRVPSFQPRHNISMDLSTSGPRPLTRDLSLPPIPSSGRASFRLRTSMTPQPQQIQREVSEPPALSSLMTNPMFVRGPPAQLTDAQRSLTPQPTSTLGTLVETVRSTKSPVRQHSSLLFGSGPSAEHTNAAREPTPAEKALHELDIYKTPLLPTRLRSANLPPTSSVTATSGVPDMFKSRRASNLVLMQDGPRTDRLGRKVSGKAVVNETKPYAGEGGMKKLLARRKMEVEDDQENDEEGEQRQERKVDDGDEDAMDDDDQTGHKVQASATLLEIPPPVPPSSKPDWYSAASSSAIPSGTSGRVGRVKSSRNHIARPTTRPKFSARFDDEADDIMDDGDEERRILEEAAKNVPEYKNPPPSFSFAKETKPIEHDHTNAKEPPISSLPFSINKPSTAPELEPQTQPKTSPFSLGSNDNALKQSGTSLFGPSVLSSASPAQESKPEPRARAPASAPVAPATNGGMPNFFANSSLLSKPLEITPPAALTFGPSTTSTTPPSFSFTPSTPSAPVKDSENPLWDGEKKKEVEKPKDEPPKTNLFGGFNAGPAKETSNAVPISFFGSAAFAPPSSPKEDAPPPSSSSSGFSFNKPATSVFSFDSGTKASAAPSIPASSIDVTGSPAPDLSAPKPLFGTSEPAKSMFGAEPSKPSALFGGEAPKQSTSLFGTDMPKPSSSPAPFSFSGSSSTTAPTQEPKPFAGFGATAEAPKPAFGTGSGSPFSFSPAPSAGVVEKEKATSPFGFGATPSTTPTADVKPGFVFGGAQPAQSSTTAAPASSFPFGGSGSTATDVSSKPFAFGQSAPAAPERPVTPPKNDQEFRMEESPTRELQQTNKPTEARPSLGGFNFNTPASSSIFGGSTTPSASPYPFGTSSNQTSNPFAPKETKLEEPQTFGGFGQATPSASTSTGFSFGGPKENAEPPRPSTGGGFPFGTTPTSANGPGPSFNFGVPSNTTGGFGQPQSGSAPSSPNTFSQPASFGFSAPPPLASSFSFGSQPASPAGGNITLPQPATPGGFGSAPGGGLGQQPAPTSPFSGPTPLASTPSSGGTLFTIGSAPTPAPAAGVRPMRKLPNRRGGGKR
ncbi:hypothetical protein BDQ12DRAFT_719643 [Crucibulum laeve]|uniref:Uncharacterized protein n=1 Tax=Crucibulum laeve TaxID=68775 RepID=A0A5C3MNP7_9AGAR|nr:hypothetical protein BDQ12DRAFT_719643 [Crucibulum laeve]